MNKTYRSASSSGMAEVESILRFADGAPGVTVGSRFPSATIRGG